MKVRDVMRAPVRSIERSGTIGDALQKMRNHRIRHLPVLADDHLVGIVSLRDLSNPGLPGRWHQTPWLSGTPVEWVMKAPVITLPANASLSKAASVMRNERINCIPVLEADRLIGILTSSDLLQLIEDRENESWRPGLGRVVSAVEG